MSCGRAHQTRTRPYLVTLSLVEPVGGVGAGTSPMAAQVDWFTSWSARDALQWTLMPHPAQL